MQTASTRPAANLLLFRLIDIAESTQEFCRDQTFGTIQLLDRRSIKVHSLVGHGFSSQIQASLLKHGIHSKTHTFIMFNCPD
jgi:hypothetical protein